MRVAHHRHRHLQKVLENVYLPGELFRHAVELFPDRVALITPEGILTFRELGERVYRLANGLKTAGVGEGGCIFTWLKDSRETLEIRLAAYEIGAAVVSFQRAHTVELIRSIFQFISPDIFIVDHEVDSDTSLLISEHLSSGQLLLTGVNNSYESLIASGTPLLNSEPVNPDAPAIISVLSRECDLPRIISFNQKGTLTAIQLLLENVMLSPAYDTSRFLSAVPFTDSSGIITQAILFAGGTLIFPREDTVEEILPLIPRYRVNGAFITPKLLTELLDYPDLERYDLNSLKNIIYSAEFIPASKLEEGIRRFGPVFQQVYGMEEILPPLTLLNHADHLLNGYPAPGEVLRSVGKGMPQVQIKIVDGENRTLENDTIGEVVVKSPTVYSESRERAGLAVSVQSDDWLYTGKLGYVDERGYLHILNHRSDLIERKERIIYPRRAEEIIHEHPVVKEACLIAAGDPEELVMCLSLRHRYRDNVSWENLKVALRRYLSDRLPLWHLPHRFELFETLPHDSNGNVHRKEIWESLCQRTLITLMAE